MKLPEIAIIVAACSAVFTASNMLVSLATYRRIKPRVEVTHEWFLFGVQEWEIESEMGMFLVRLSNKSQTAVSVRDVYLNLELDANDIVEPAKDFSTSLAIVKGDISEEIPPFSGIDLRVEPDDFMMELTPYVRRVRVVAALANGVKVKSRWTGKASRWVMPFEEVEKCLEAYGVAKLGWSPSPERQLSFDDPDEVEG
ncbi:hypothetical protein ACFQ7B_34220 [Streptomyces erythrochromogenes]|uniref:hypothetical protein n=1 Tax=Streptomyces erythrochromogenes TaxID=285574 RepID=UPI00368F5FAA